MAHVRPLPKKQDGSRRYQVRYLGPDGRERAKNFSRRADADRFAASVETDKARGEWIDPRLGKTTVAEWSEGWLARMAHVQPKTWVGYESLLRTCVLPAFGTTTLARVEQPAGVPRGFHVANAAGGSGWAPVVGSDRRLVVGDTGFEPVTAVL